MSWKDKILGTTYKPDVSISSLRSLLRPLHVKHDYQRNAFIVTGSTGEIEASVSISLNEFIRAHSGEIETMVSMIKKQLAYKIHAQITKTYLESAEQCFVPNNDNKYIVDTRCPEEETISIVHPRAYTQILRG